MGHQFFRGTIFLAILITLLTVNASAENVSYAVEGGNIYFDTATGTISYCDKSVTNADIPLKINGLDVTSIGSTAFRWCSSLTNVTIPSSVTNIGKRAFHGCSSLTNVTIPPSVISIGDEAFLSCGRKR